MAFRFRLLLTGAAGLLTAGVVAACSTGAAPATTTSAAVIGSTSAAPATTGTGAPPTETNPPGDIPDTQAFVDYSSTAGYGVKVPEGWARTDSGASTTFTDKYNSITIDVAANPTAPTISTGQAELAALRVGTPGFTGGAVSTVQRPAGGAVLITYQADSPPNPVTGKVVVQAVERYEFYRAGTTATVTLSAPAGSDNVDPWRTVTDSFRWTS